MGHGHGLEEGSHVIKALSRHPLFEIQVGRLRERNPRAQIGTPRLYAVGHLL